MKAILVGEFAHVGGVLAEAWSPTGLALATACDKAVSIWDVTTSQRGLTLHHASLVCCVDWSRDGQLVASGTSDGNVHVWDSRSGSLVWQARSHSDEVRSVAFSPDGAALASGANDAVVRMARVADGALQAEMRGHADLVRSVAWSPNGRQRLSGSHDRTVRAWGPSGTCVGQLADHTGWVSAVTYTAGGELVSAGCDSSVRVWDTSAGAYRLVLTDFDEWWVTDVSPSPDGRHLAAIDSNGFVRIFSIADGRMALSFEADGWARTVRWSPDGVHIATGGNATIDSEKLWRIDTTDVDADARMSG